MLALIALAAAAAQSAPPTLPGIWEGTVGTLPVRACFVARDWGPFGAYYYLSQRRLIALDSSEAGPTTFREGVAEDANAPRWQIQSVSGNQLQGRWAGNRRVLPVRLTRVAAATGEDSACASMAFHQPLLAGVRTVSRRATADGVAYTKITLDHGGRFDARVETFALDGAGDATRRVNALLGRTLAGNPPEWFDCLRSPLQTGPMDGGLSETFEPVMITRRWLSVNHQYDGFCGGAHPNSGTTYETYDLAAGAQVDLHDWFGPEAVRRERFEGSEDEAKTLLPPLRDAILAGWRSEGDAECSQVVRDAEFWNIGLRRTGFVFAPSLPHVSQACGEEFTVPFARVRQFLTREGAANVDALR